MANRVYDICISTGLVSLGLVPLTSTSEVFQIIQMSLAIISLIVSLVFRVSTKLKEAKKDGIITHDEVKDIIDDVANTVKAMEEIKDEQHK